MIPFKPFSKVDAAFQGKITHSTQQQGISPKDLFLLKQVHGDGILFLQTPEDVSNLRMTVGDAVLCSLPDVSIAVKTADCVPILLAHPEGIIGAVHAGWRGTDQRLLTKVLERLRQDFQISLSDVQLAIGPAISPERYPVGVEVAERFFEGIFKGVTQPFNDKYLLDLKIANARLAHAAGIPTKNIEVHPHCTFQRTEFYSYRRAQQEGRSSEGRNYSWIRLIP